MSQQPTVEVEKSGIPAGLWMRCPACGAMLFRKAMEENLHVCPECQHHFRISARERVRQICDENSFEERYPNLESVDPLGFNDKKAYA
ncbi:MAG: acetyl-CoA carboxylase carboxyl transferase subunit beta, partial [Proteobacteria bacterium]